jgi:hypothetical protein
MGIDDQTATLLKALRIENTDTFKIYTFEALGALLLMSHWLRGVFTWAHWVGALEYQGKKYSIEAEEANYKRLNHNLELYEELLWKFLPPRAMLQQLRLWREQGYIDKEFEELLRADVMGHYDRNDAKVTEIIDRSSEVDGRKDIPLR